MKSAICVAFQCSRVTFGWECNDDAFAREEALDAPDGPYQIAVRRNEYGDVEPILELQADGVAISGKLDYAQIKDGALKRNCCFARSILSSSLLDTTTAVGDSTTDCLTSAGKGFFLSTEWDVPYATSVNNMHEVMRIIRDNKGS